MNGVRPNVRFTCDEDVWEIIDILVAETNALNKKKGKNFDVAASIKSQLPFFGCSKAIYDEDFLKDLERYYYCKEFKVSPYPGSFDEQPTDWVEKTFIIKTTLNKKEKELYAKAKNNS